MARLTTRIESALDELERDGTLTAPQRAAVSDRVGRAVRAGLGLDVVTIVAALGALLVAAGFLYLLGYHWVEFSKGLKLALVFGLWALVHAAGFVLGERPGRHPRLGRALTLVGVLAFGGAVGLVAQVYHLASHYPHAMLAWWVLGIPIALVTRSRAILAAVMGVAIVWIAWHLGVWLEDRPEARDREGIACYLVVALQVAAALHALAALAARSVHEGFAPVLRAPILPLACLAPFLFAFHQPWWDAGQGPVLAATLLPVYVAAACAALLLAFASARSGLRAARDGWLLAGTGALLAAGVLLAPRSVPFLANAALFGGALALVALGVREARSALVTTGIFLFVLGAVARYFEYLFSRLEGAYAFLATGAILMVAAFAFENRRRALSKRVREAAP